MASGNVHALKRRTVRHDVAEVISTLLEERSGISARKFSVSLIPHASPPEGWGEPSGASWAGALKKVELRLHTLRPEYNVLRITPTDGHKTWKLPLAITVHLLTEKIVAGNHVAAKISLALSKT